MNATSGDRRVHASRKERRNRVDAHFAGCTASASWWFDRMTLTLSGCSPHTFGSFVRSLDPGRVDFGAKIEPALAYVIRNGSRPGTRKTRLSPSTFESDALQNAEY